MSHRLYVAFSASQMKLLGRILPLIVADLVPEALGTVFAYDGNSGHTFFSTSY